MDSTLYDPDSGDGDGGGDGGGGGGAELGVYVHHARGIHNVCIYARQDVYAKLSLTRSPDAAVSTRVAAAGGADPRFDELVAVGRVASPRSAVLKCELWTLSRAPSLLEDQLLGFALVPLSSVAAAAAAGRTLTQDFSLSSTDLFHSPAGTVRLTLSLHSPAVAAAPAPAPAASSSAGITSEVVILDPADYRRLDPPDVALDDEDNRQMVAEYFDIMSPPAPPLRLAADYDMTSDSPDDNPSSTTTTTTTTTTSLTDQSKKIAADSSSSSSPSSSSSNSSTAEVGTPTSKCENDSKERKVGPELRSVFESPLGNINVEAEQAAMQRQIVEMYMKSMQQFTESLANMKLPMDLDSSSSSNNDTKLDAEEKKKQKKDASRVFYGSRAFF